MDISEILGKTFTASGGELYGSIRALGDDVPEGGFGGGVPFATDECGNLFVLKDAKVWFWDHETDDMQLLASSVSEFSKGCTVGTHIRLDATRVLSARIDPEFASKVGASPVQIGRAKKP